MTIVIGCDNAAVDLKNTLADFLRKKGITVEDEGCMEATDPTVYPVIAKRVCENIINSGYTKRGILGLRDRYRHVHDRQQVPGHPGGGGP